MWRVETAIGPRIKLQLYRENKLIVVLVFAWQLILSQSASRDRRLGASPNARRKSALRAPLLGSDKWKKKIEVVERNGYRLKVPDDLISILK